MKRQRLMSLAAAFLAAAAAGCFDDPTSDLRNGPSLVQLDRSVVNLASGDSVAVVATVKDDQGNALAATGATWATGDANVAVVNADAVNTAPGDAFSRAFIRAVATVVDTTQVTVTVRGLTGTVRVYTSP